MLGEEPPVIAVMGRQPVGEGQLLRLAPRPPAEADKPEHAAAGLGNHGVARPFPEMREDGVIGARPVAVDEQAERVQVAGLPGRAAVCGGPRGGHRVRCLARPPPHLQRPRPAGMGEREGRVFQGGPREALLGARIGAEEQVRRLDIGVARRRRCCREGEAVTVAEHRARSPRQRVNRGGCGGCGPDRPRRPVRQASMCRRDCRNRPRRSCAGCAA